MFRNSEHLSQDPISVSTRRGKTNLRCKNEVILISNITSTDGNAKPTAKRERTLQDIRKCMGKYHADGRQEIRWTGAGETKYMVVTIRRNV